MDDDLETGDQVETGQDDAGGEKPAKPGLSRDEYHAKMRAEFLAGGSDDDDGVEVSAEKPAAKKPAGPAPDDDDDDVVVDDDDDDEALAAAADDDEEDEPKDDDDDLDVDDDDEDEDEDEDALAAKAKADPELAKRLKAVRVTEQRQRQAMERDRAAMERERTEWQTERKTLTERSSKYDQLAQRVRVDPYGVLAELGVPDDEMEYVATQAYARSPKAKDDPKYRAAAERAMRDRAAEDKVGANEKRIAELEAKIAQRDQVAEADRVLDTYFGRVTKRADDTAPLTKKLLETNPKRARVELETTAFKLAQKLGQLPKPKFVIAAHEKKLARELRDLGVDAPAGAKPAAKGKPAAAAKPSAKPTEDPAKPTNGATGRPTFPTREEMLAEMEAGDLSS